MLETDMGTRILFILCTYISSNKKSILNAIAFNMLFLLQGLQAISMFVKHCLSIKRRQKLPDLNADELFN
jgi:hypothetical protein